MVIDLKKDFTLRTIMNMAKRLVREKQVEKEIWVSIEEDTESPYGYSIYYFEIQTQRKLKVNPEKLYAYYLSLIHIWCREICFIRALVVFQTVFLLLQDIE